MKNKFLLFDIQTTHYRIFLLIFFFFFFTWNFSHTTSQCLIQCSTVTKQRLHLTKIDCIVLAWMLPHTRFSTNTKFSLVYRVKAERRFSVFIVCNVEKDIFLRYDGVGVSVRFTDIWNGKMFLKYRVMSAITVLNVKTLQKTEERRT